LLRQLGKPREVVLSGLRSRIGSDLEFLEPILGLELLLVDLDLLVDELLGESESFRFSPRFDSMKIDASDHDPLGLRASGRDTTACRGCAAETVDLEQ
jgi:hypothetical protein